MVPQKVTSEITSYAVCHLRKIIFHECNMNLWVPGITVGWSLRTQLVLNVTSTMGWGREAQQHGIKLENLLTHAHTSL